MAPRLQKGVGTNMSSSLAGPFHAICFFFFEVPALIQAGYTGIFPCWSRIAVTVAAGLPNRFVGDPL